MAAHKCPGDTIRHLFRPFVLGNKFYALATPLLLLHDSQTILSKAEFAEVIVEEGITLVRDHLDLEVILFLSKSDILR